MIQRIQSLFLLLSSLGFLGQFGTDFANSTKSIPQYFADQKYEIQDSGILLGITILGALISLGAIFLYNNRPLQQKMSVGALVLSILLPVAAFLLIYTEKTAMDSSSDINDSLGLYLPIISVIGSALAMKYIKKDDKLVRSMDRLR